MIENFSHLTITYGVRSEFIINDVTEKEAIASGLDQVSKIISTGCSAPGAILEDCSDEFIDIYNKNLTSLCCSSLSIFSTLIFSKLTILSVNHLR